MSTRQSADRVWRSIRTVTRLELSPPWLALAAPPWLALAAPSRRAVGMMVVGGGQSGLRHASRAVDGHWRSYTYLLDGASRRDPVSSSARRVLRAYPRHVMLPTWPRLRLPSRARPDRDPLPYARQGFPGGHTASCTRRANVRPPVDGDGHANVLGVSSLHPWSSALP
jgi:hypothetical protein